MRLRYLYQDKKVPLKNLVKLYKEHSVTSIFRHANKPTGQVVHDRRKYNLGRPKKLSAKDERKIVHQWQRCSLSIFTFNVLYLIRGVSLSLLKS